MSNKILKGLQVFADADEGTNNQGTEGAEGSTAEDQERNQSNQGEPESEEESEEENADRQQKKYTDADVDRIIAKKIAAERKRMSKLFNEQQETNELEERERNVAKREMMADAKDALIKDELPYTLSGLLDYSDKESYEQSYQEVTKIFREAVQQQIKLLLKGKTPRVSTGLRDAARDPIAKAFARK